jgi:hypothetical protein
LCIAVAPWAMKTAERTPKMVYNESLPGVSRKTAAKTKLHCARVAIPSSSYNYF